MRGPKRGLGGVGPRSLRHLTLLVATGFALSGSPAAGGVGTPGLAISATLPDPSFAGTSVHETVQEFEYPYTFPRATQDRPDERPGAQVHPIYLLPSGKPDDGLDTQGVIETSMRSVNHWMRQQTTDLQWRLDTYTFTWDDPETVEPDQVPVEAVDVTFVQSQRNPLELNDILEVDAELKALGFDQPNKRYLAFVASDGEGQCGEAWYAYLPMEDDFDGKYSVVYLDSVPGCRAREFASDPQSPSHAEMIVAQEIIHNDAMVPMIAPHNCWFGQGPNYGHVCTSGLPLTGLDPERFDVAFPFVGLPLSQKQLDIDDDDYFRHPFPYRDLENSPYLERIN